MKNSARLLQLCFLLLVNVISLPLVAEEIIKVDEAETQLAKRMADREELDTPYDFWLSAGYRVDKLAWGVAMDGINPSSEVIWDETGISVLNVAGRYSFAERLFIDGSLSYGSVHSGINRDSDYAASNRSQEYSRSFSDTGGSVDDLSLAIGLRLIEDPLTDNSRVTFAVLAGTSIHNQNLIMFNGRRKIPFEAMIENLHNLYDAEWQSGWGGVDWQLIIEKFSLRILAKHHLVDYVGKADWNLRQDFSHPLSFRHDAKGRGSEFLLEASYKVYPRVAVNINASYQSWKAEDGVETTYFSSGIIEYNPMNTVVLKSRTLSLGVGYQF